MKPPDAFEKMVEKVYEYSTWRNTIQVPDAVMLLRRQHARVVRLVKALPCAVAARSSIQSCAKTSRKFCTVYRADMLAALARMKRGE